MASRHDTHLLEYSSYPSTIASDNIRAQKLLLYSKSIPLSEVNHEKGRVRERQNWARRTLGLEMRRTHNHKYKNRRGRQHGLEALRGVLQAVVKWTTGFSIALARSHCLRLNSN
jgi:hypothetical protein